MLRLHIILSAILLSALLVTDLFSRPSLAIYDPLHEPNNKVGVHILSPDELESATKLVNNNNQGQWGYVTVPIQAWDHDLEKWTRFMKKAKELKVIPLIRIATTVNDVNWQEPNSYDLIDFANFLNDLPWPVENRYVIIFNEVNRADEFGGVLSPERYTDILNNAIEIFKARSEKFFILPAGLDNAAPNLPGYIRWSDYLLRMYNHNSEIFNKIDGWTSHAYPNPAFSAQPFKSGSNKIDSFKSDLKYLRNFTAKKLPVFITETGWNSDVLRQDTIGEYYNFAFVHVWSDPQVVAVTPFLLRAGVPPFDKFSLLDKHGHPTSAYLSIQKFATTGLPRIEPEPTPTPTPTPTLSATPDLTSIPTISVASEVLASESLSPAESKQMNFLERMIHLISTFFTHTPFDTEVLVGDQMYQTEVVSSATDMQIGLSKYSSLSDHQAMLFQFPDQRERTFWMKDMKFDIDIAWIKNGKVVGVTRGLSANPKELLPSPGIVDMVLEVNPDSGIKVGDTITVKK